MARANQTGLSNYMRVLLRDLDTGLYFQQPDRWTAEDRNAHCFKSSIEALETARQKGFKSAEVYLAFRDRRYNLRISLA